MKTAKLNLALFDAIRQNILGHAVTLDHRVIRSIQATSLEDILIQYARLLRAAYEVELQAHHDWYDSAPLPVMPAVDLADLSIRHETCTGNTRLVVNKRGLIVSKTDNPDSTRTKAIILCDTTSPSRREKDEIGELISWLYNTAVGASEDNGY